MLESETFLPDTVYGNERSAESGLFPAGGSLAAAVVTPLFRCCTRSGPNESEKGNYFLGATHQNVIFVRIVSRDVTFKSSTRILRNCL